MIWIPKDVKGMRKFTDLGSFNHLHSYQINNAEGERTSQKQNTLEMENYAHMVESTYRI